MKSVWSQMARPVTFDTLKQDLKVDVLIIGGGMAGLLCAYMLEQAGVDYILVEANKICSGITMDTTAKITCQHGLIYDKLIRTFGTDAAQMYLDANQSALEMYRTICGTIDCDFQLQDAIVYSKDNRRKIEKELAALDKLGAAAEFTLAQSLPFAVAGAVRVPQQAQFHPLKFAYAIAKDLRIFEDTKILELRPDGAVTHNGKISADKIIVATHFPFLNKHGSYFLKLYQHRSYVLALQHAGAVNGMFVDEDKKGMSFRYYGDLLLVGGGSHRTGKKGGNWQELAEFARRTYPGAQEVFRWATQDCMTLDGVPYIGQYSGRTPNLYVAAGFNKWGMSSSMAAAQILTAMVLGKDCPYAEVFSPSRTILRPQLAVNAAETVISLLTPTAPRCPHMGCALKYNPQEHSWDCSCHGSRFTKTGKLINNPATNDKRIMKKKTR